MAQQRKWPIVMIGDWMQLTYEQANTKEEALLNAAQRYVDEVNKDGWRKLRIGPRGVTGHHTPVREIRILDADTCELESEWTIPMEF